jgi:hypothetical protein
MRGVAEHIPSVKRYALVPNDSDKGLRRFHLARVASAPAAPGAGRLERMEEIAARDREDAERRSPPADQAAS